MKETRYIAYFVTEEDLFMPKEAFLSYEEAARELEAFLAEVSGDYGVEYKEEDSEEREDFEEEMFQRGVYRWDVRQILV